MAATVSAAGSSSRSLTTTLAPSAASLSATARPMPRPEPEMIATLPLNLLIVRFLVLGDRDDGFAIERLPLVVRPCAYFQARPAFAVFLAQFCELAATLQRRVAARARREPALPAHPKIAKTTGR